MLSLVRELRASGGLARRSLLLLVVGVVLAAAGIVSAVVLLGDGGEDEPEYPPAKPLRLVAPATLDDVFTVTGEPGELPAEDLDAVVRAVRGYLIAATIAPLEYDPEAEEDGDEEEARRRRPRPLSRFFAEAAAGRLDGEDRRALADDHLPHAPHGVSTERATLALTALLDEAGAGQLVSATIDVHMEVRLDDEVITIHRSGDFVLERVDDAWRIGAYNVRVERAFADRTTTTEAAFG